MSEKLKKMHKNLNLRRPNGFWDCDQSNIFHVMNNSSGTFWSCWNVSCHFVVTEAIFFKISIFFSYHFSKNVENFEITHKTILNFGLGCSSPVRTNSTAFTCLIVQISVRDVFVSPWTSLISSLNIGLPPFNFITYFDNKHPVFFWRWWCIPVDIVDSIRGI